MIDAMAERYGVLPSKILREGDTFDLMIMDCAFTYRKFIEAKHDPKQDITDMYDQEQLKQVMESTKNGDRNKL
tara:strand:- start:47 stop:265 length:219 start_codon:yes stop_codon:yes gene_type:complete